MSDRPVGMQLAEDFRSRKWLTVRRTYHVAGADTADVGDLACGFPAGHCEVDVRSRNVRQNSMTTSSNVEEASKGRSVTKVMSRSWHLLGGEDR